MFTDGGCKPNPGRGSIGIVILDQDGQELECFCSSIDGESTSNQAEYKALIKGLDLAAKHCRFEVYCWLDSTLILKQLKAEYRLRNPELRKLWHEVINKERPFEKVVYQYADDSNPNIKKAHRLAKQARSNARFT